MSQTVQQHLQTYAIHYWLVVSTPLKNMSSSDWIIIPTIGENIKFHGSSHHQPAIKKKKNIKIPIKSTINHGFFPHLPPYKYTIYLGG